MNEYEKNQDKARQTDEQGKPAFDQFDKEKGQQQQQGEIRKEQPAGTGREGGEGRDEQQR